MKRSAYPTAPTWAAAFLLALASLTATAGERHSIVHGDQRLEVVDRDGLAIWQGDIIIGKTADVLEATRKADLAGAPALPAVKGTGMGTATGRWPRGASGLFEMPYVIELDPQNRVPATITEFNRQMTGMFRAVPRTTETDYVAFTFESEVNACSSSLGRVGGRQVIQGIPSCSVGVLLHEIGHALGLYHEQTREDNGVWVSIDLDGVDPGFAHNYRGSINQRDLGIYDYGSLMHYGSSGFSKRGTVVLDSIPPGIPFGQREGYSRGDIDALRRLYGLFDATIVIDTFPRGLNVLIDGTSRVTPVELTWPIGSTHTLEVPANVQVLNGVVHTFARWSSDSAGTLSARQTITVNPGNGTITEPAAFPAVTVYTANFVRMTEVTLAASSNRAGIRGTLNAVPPPAPVPGITGTYYRERQAFTLTPVPDAGAAFGRWNGSFSFPIATTTRHAATMRGPLAFSTTLGLYDFNAYFVDYPFVTIRARSQDGEFFGVNATVARGIGSLSQRLPYSTVEITSPWRAGETATVTLPATATPFGTTIRYLLASVDGVGGGVTTADITHPSPGQASTELIALYNKQYQPFRQVNPSCAGSITIAPQVDGWVNAGAPLSVTVMPASGWVLTRWRRSLSGTGTNRDLTANDVPDVVADLNIVPMPLVVNEVRPASVNAGQPVTLEILGQGFASTSRVLVAGLIKAASSIEEGRIVVPLTANDIPSSGMVIVTVQNRTAAGCALNVSGTFDVLAAQTQNPVPLHDYSDLWWNAGEAGWGLNLIQHASNVLFGVMYTYDDGGKPMWLVIPGGTWTSSSVYTGSLYRVTGPAFNSPTFNPALVNVRAVGIATISFAGRDSATFTFSVDGRNVVKSIVRQPF